MADVAQAYRYEAVGADGQVVRGQQLADDLDELIADLSRQGLTLLAIPRAGAQRSSGGSVRGRRVKPVDVAQLASYVAVTSRAGLSVVDSIEDFAEDRPPGLRALLDRVVAHVRAGNTLAEGFAAQPRAFDPAFLALVRAGESSGTLGEALDGAARQIGFQCEVRGKLRQALVQPAILLCCVMGLVTLLITYLLPRITGMLADANVELPASTAALLALSDFLVSNWPVLVGGLLASSVGLRLALRTPRGQRALDALLLALPVFGPIVRLSAEARFVSTMSTLMRSGVDAVRSLRLSADTTGSAQLGGRLHAAADRVSEGATMTEALTAECELQPLVRRMIQLGESAGGLHETLETAVAYLSVELPRRVGRAVAVIEPTIIVFSGVLVAFILLSALLPVFSLYESY